MKESGRFIITPLGKKKTKSGRKNFYDMNYNEVEISIKK